MTEYVAVYKLSEKDVQNIQKLLLKKVSDTNEFIRSNANECLKSLTLRNSQISMLNFLILLKSGFYSTLSGATLTSSQNSAASRLAISKCLTELFKSNYVT